MSSNIREGKYYLGTSMLNLADLLMLMMCVIGMFGEETCNASGNKFMHLFLE